MRRPRPGATHANDRRAGQHLQISRFPQPRQLFRRRARHRRLPHLRVRLCRRAGREHQYLPLDLLKNFVNSRTTRFNGKISIPPPPARISRVHIPIDPLGLKRATYGEYSSVWREIAKRLSLFALRSGTETPRQWRRSYSTDSGKPENCHHYQRYMPGQDKIRAPDLSANLNAMIVRVAARTLELNTAIIRRGTRIRRAR
jgi:hypothetical protein